MKNPHQSANPLDHVTRTTTSLQSLARLIQIERLEREARRDVIEGLQTMEQLLEKINILSTQSLEEHQHEINLLSTENISLKRSIDQNKKEIQLLQDKLRETTNEKEKLNALYENRIGQLEEELSLKDQEVDALENEVMKTVQEYSSRLSEDSQNMKDSDDKVETLQLKKQLRKQETTNNELINKLGVMVNEIEELKNAAELNSQTNDVMWMTIMKGRHENNALKIKIDELEKGIGPSEADIFEGYVQRSELSAIKEWVCIEHFEKVKSIEGDEPTHDWDIIEGLTNVLCIKVTQIGSVFGYFHRTAHPKVTAWDIPETTEIVFSLRNLFNHPPIVIKQNTNGKLVENRPADVCVPIITEEMDSPCLCSMILTGV
ncbi:TLDc domain-containing protein [Entamoeba marina]